VSIFFCEKRRGPNGNAHVYQGLEDQLFQFVQFEWKLQFGEEFGCVILLGCGQWHFGVACAAAPSLIAVPSTLSLPLSSATGFLSPPPPPPPQLHNFPHLKIHNFSMQNSHGRVTVHKGLITTTRTNVDKVLWTWKREKQKVSTKFVPFSARDGSQKMGPSAKAAAFPCKKMVPTTPDGSQAKTQRW